MNAASVPLYTPAQRWVALLYGLTSHALFLASVMVMCVSLYHGLSFGLLHLHGWAALSGDALLLGQFVIGHSLLLTDKGRRWMTRLAPLGLGKDLATTIFAGLASLQLLLVFLCWSPSGVLWAAPEGGLKAVLTLLYSASWLLLAKSMSDAGLDAQIGSLGWRAVWRGQRPAYQPFARAGMFRHSRQPIYSSFSLILWTAPVWTMDHLFMAVLWTAYCVLAPLAKERRYLRWYGEAFARYQQRVPYWIPGKMRASISQSVSPVEYDAAIVGAGPVGLLLAALLGRKGLRVLVLEQRAGPPAHSRAIGITPPSLEILARLGLEEAFVRRGVRIQDCHVHGDSGRLGCASFRDLPGRHPFILSLPQRQTLELLEGAVAALPAVTLRRGLEVTGLAQEKDAVTLTAGDFTARARWVIGCDGHRSRVRELLRMRTRGGDYGCHFLMGDFADRSCLQDEAHLWFTAEGAVESFPLPGGMRRWIVQTDAPVPETARGTLRALVQSRAGIGLADADQLNQSAFSPRWMQAERYHDGRVILCGDAAHVMSPIGGQGMNTGWADAEFLALALESIEHRRQAAQPWLEAYERCRRRASRAATARAAQGMWLGTRTGRLSSWLREVFLREVLFQPPLSRHIGPRFAMLTLPCATLERVPAGLLPAAHPAA